MGSQPETGRKVMADRSPIVHNTECARAVDSRPRRRATMSCSAVVRHSDDVAIVDLSGRITLGEGSGMVRNTIKDLVSSGHRKILLNLGEVSYIDSAGLGELVSAYATVRN